MKNNELPYFSKLKFEMNPDQNALDAMLFHPNGYGCWVMKNEDGLFSVMICVGSQSRWDLAFYNPICDSESVDSIDPLLVDDLIKQVSHLKPIQGGLQLCEN